MLHDGGANAYWTYREAKNSDLKTKGSIDPIYNLYHSVPVAQWLEHCVSSAKVVGSFPREHVLTKICIAWMHCKSLWIKASAKCINVQHKTCMIIDLEMQDTVTVNKSHVWNFYLTCWTIKPGCVMFHLKNELQQQTYSQCFHMQIIQSLLWELGWNQDISRPMSYVNARVLL